MREGGNAEGGDGEDVKGGGRKGREGRYGF